MWVWPTMVEVSWDYRTSKITPRGFHMFPLLDVKIKITLKCQKQSQRTEEHFTGRDDEEVTKLIKYYFPIKWYYCMIKSWITESLEPISEQIQYLGPDACSSRLQMLFPFSFSTLVTGHLINNSMSKCSLGAKQSCGGDSDSTDGTLFCSVATDLYMLVFEPPSADYCWHRRKFAGQTELNLNS